MDELHLQSSACFTNDVTEINLKLQFKGEMKAASGPVGSLKIHEPEQLLQNLKKQSKH